MEWNDSGIGPAIQQAKSMKVLFIVVIHGEENDENSNNFMDLMDDSSVAGLLTKDTCVAIKLKHESEGCKQFNALYPVVLIPSIYFIDSSNGIDVEVTGGAQITKERLLQSIHKAMAAAKITPQGAISNPDSVLSPRGVRVEQAREVIRQTWEAKKGDNSETEEPNSKTVEGNESTGTASTTSLSLEERVARAKELLASKREKELDETNDKEKNTEKERRELGKQMQNFKRTQEEKDAQKAAEERRKDREETKLARERVKAQIEQDRLEKQAKFDVQKHQELEEKKKQEKASLEEKAAHAERLAAARSTLARIQFRLPEGGTRTNAFPADAPLADVYKYVGEELSDFVTFRSGFSLYVTFPRSLLDEKSMDAPLRDLGLAPSGTILVLPKSTSIAKSGGSVGGIMDLVWLLLTPLTIFWGLLTSFIGTPNPSTNTTTPISDPTDRNVIRNQRQTKPNTATTRSDGNITSLRNMSDDDEENNTWNGNSTQQQ